MKTTLAGPSFSLPVKLLVLTCLVLGGAVSLTTSAARSEDDRLAADEDGIDAPLAKDVAEPGPAPVKARGIPTRLSELFIAGGPLMWPIAACSVVVLAFAFERMVVL